jgi:cell wall-associated NlpC family hydrolase
MQMLLRCLCLSSAVLVSACSSPPVAPPPHSNVSHPDSYSQAADNVLLQAIGLVGTPYRYGGNTPAGGFDCSGLIVYVYRDAAGVQLPRTTLEMQALPAPTVKREALQTGDLVFFATQKPGQVSHAGIYVGDGRFVHAPSAGGLVRLESLSSRYWSSRYLSAKRILSTPSLADAR